MILSQRHCVLNLRRKYTQSPPALAVLKIKSKINTTQWFMKSEASIDSFAVGRCVEVNPLQSKISCLPQQILKNGVAQPSFATFEIYRDGTYVTPEAFREWWRAQGFLNVKQTCGTKPSPFVSIHYSANNRGRLQVSLEDPNRGDCPFRVCSINSHRIEHHNSKSQQFWNVGNGGASDERRAHSSILAP
jgi:hypothetical protein